MALLTADIKYVFNKIASNWYNYRHHSIFSKELKILAQRWQQGKLLNLGCAHGPDFIPFKGRFQFYGIDFSEEMLSLARKYSKKYDFKVKLSLADVRQLPYSDNSFDFAISIATYHHIKGESERLKALNELKRVLKPGGEAFITVWNRWQPKFWLKPKELYVSWHKQNETLYRFYYLFSYAELEKLAIEAGFTLVRSYPDSTYHFFLKHFSRNICLLIKKNPS
ncbi:MAG: methyltransferase domain-containing protein [Dehalococcoidia bacterium]|nr:MAG: methyltransferase domain-containing protein [Dehalococcoidia bacterium]